jgi:hypothetical protein
VRTEEISQDQHLAEARAWLQERGLTPPLPRPVPITALPPVPLSKKKRQRRKGRPLQYEEVGVTCYCGQVAVLQSNALKYGRQYGQGYGWFCSRWPDCPGYCGTHPDGRPLGTLADPATHRKRTWVHDAVDPLWREEGYSRGAVYGWLATIMGRDHVHIGGLNLEECDELLALIRRHPFTPPRRRLVRLGR